ncbi:MAG: adenylate/guanylate cyclase domain-containing protein [Myxococcaceae bacterium]|nr:adenylate/guanylate cyclase domain-containing protein [Myxococcaceae bacterium]
MPVDPADDLGFAIARASNAALAKGALAAGVTATMATVAVTGLSRASPWLVMPAFTVGAIAAWCFGVFALARRGLVVGQRAWLVLLSLHALPVASAVIARDVVPFGPATFLFGPIGFVFLVAVVLSGLSFDPALARVSGFVGGAGLFVFHALSRRSLLTLEPALERGFFHDLTDVGVAALRSFVIVGVGFLVAAAAQASRELVHRVRDEERERRTLHGLFGQYVSDAVRDKLLRDKAGVEGERKTVAVLFCDLRGFTTFSEGLEPAEVVLRLNAYFEKMVAAVTAHGGVVDKFIGDAVMATFGGLLERPNPCDDAFDAALAMRAGLVELNAQLARAGLSPLDNGIGIHFGEVLQGPIGSEARREFTVIGDTVNTASRLESATKELSASIVLSAAAAERLSPERRARLAALGEVRLKGKAQPVPVEGVRVG